MGAPRISLGLIGLFFPVLPGGAGFSPWEITLA